MFRRDLTVTINYTSVQLKRSVWSYIVKLCDRLRIQTFITLIIKLLPMYRILWCFRIILVREFMAGSTDSIADYSIKNLNVCFAAFNN